MEYKIEKKSAPGREEVEVLGATFEEGKPEGEELGQWRLKLSSREEKLKYLQEGERYMLLLTFGFDPGGLLRNTHRPFE